MFGPVQDVRIPYQQKRMFGFVTFVYAETVKVLLSKGNPHFVCDARVLVKPYKEKGKVPDRFRSVRSFSLALPALHLILILPYFSSFTLHICNARRLLVCLIVSTAFVFIYRFVWLQEAAARAPWRRRVRRLHVAHRIAGFQGPLRSPAAPDR